QSKPFNRGVAPRLVRLDKTPNNGVIIMQYVVIENANRKAIVVDSAEEAEKMTNLRAEDIAWACEEYGRCDGELHVIVQFRIRTSKTNNFGGDYSPLLVHFRKGMVAPARARTRARGFATQMTRIWKCIVILSVRAPGRNCCWVYQQCLSSAPLR